MITNAMKIADILSPASVKVPLESSEKQAVIHELIDLLAASNLITDAAKLKAVVWEREMQRSTGIGEGLAIPHGKADCSPNLVMAIGRPATPIDFASVDRNPVRLVVLLASPTTKTSDHIQALSKISRLMVNAEFREACFNAPTAQALFELFVDADE